MHPFILLYVTTTAAAALLRFQATRDARQAREPALLQQQDELLSGFTFGEHDLNNYKSGVSSSSDNSSSNGNSNGSGGSRFRRKENDRAAVERRVMAKRTPLHDQVLRYIDQGRK